MVNLDTVDWDKIAQSQQFIEDLFAGRNLTRPGIIIHYPGVPAPELPVGMPEHEQSVARFEAEVCSRPLGEDDYVPALGTGSGTCTMATAFGSVEVKKDGLSWPTPVITDPAQIDRLTVPAVTAGRLGAVLEQTRAFDRHLDHRLWIRNMDFQSPFTTVEQILGSDLFFLMPYDEPRRLHRLMEIVTDLAIAFFKAQIAAAGARCCRGLWPMFWFPKSAGIQMSDDNLCNVSPEVYDEFVVPYNNRIAAAFGGLFFHSCIIRENNLASLHKLQRLTGINCDISNSVSPGVLLREFGHRAVISPHAYINTDARFQSYGAFMERCLGEWKPGQRLFVYPCATLYEPASGRDLPFDGAAVRQAMRRVTCSPAA